MASITKKSNGRFQARYRDAAGVERSHRFDKRKDAQAWLDTITTAVQTGTYVDPKAGKVSVGRIAPTWLKVKSGKKPKTYAGYESLLNGHVLPRWGRVPVAAITTADIEAWLSELTGSGLSASRVRQAYTVLRGVLGMAVKSRNLAVNPALGVDLPTMPTSRKRYLTMGQLESLADSSGDYGLLVRVLGYCGLRWGEAAALTVGKCDLLRSRLHVDASLVDIAGKLSIGTPKSDHARDVPLSRFLRDELAAHVAGKGTDELVFPAPRGGYLRNPNFRRGYFDRAVREAGLDGLVPHELRHTAASLAIQSGANIKVVQTMLGHSSATLTWDRYGHLYDDDLDSVAERMDAARAKHLRESCGQTADNSGNVVKLG